MSNWKHGAPRVAFISGGGSGIGLRLAGALLQEGARVAIFDLHVDESVLADLRGKQAHAGGWVESYTVDITDPVAVTTSMDLATAEVGVPDFAINCAGILRTAEFSELAFETFEQSIRVNLIGSRNFAAGALRHMQPGGHLALVASLAGICGSYTHAAYSASKFGVVGLAEVLRTELTPEGIDVSVVCPGEIHTPMLEEERRTGRLVTEVINEFAGVMPVDKAVDGILAGLRKRQYMITPGFRARLTRAIARKAPGLFHRIIDGKVRQGLAREQRQAAGSKAKS
ncbi:SDR family NAD(P)-dependent oxidoreductase [Microbulbifer sp. YPW16]|uniref:SDR family NAD(P)-dependent oxidoreductase n=1 Tax=Microbulbifer sp. YPW16 TaxID=2904242 RepID=UPI001E394586|nr:SDR family NAD(P)-dependent oxidoreductase [Microbulbifer sp. YPW16]UHQ54933.1 SDR family NAD(P)-dependent oxidoreductase [Microbulbifer sp. YPW16]